MKIVFFSDTHLDRTHTRKTELVERFIREVCPEGDIIFLLGDIFEFYHGFSYVYPWYQGVVGALRDLTAQGKTVYFLEGNHEFDMGSHFQTYAGVKCAESVSIDVDGKRLIATHGDEFAGGAVRTILKSRLIAGVMDFLGPRLTWRGAMMARIFLSKGSKPYKGGSAGRFRGYAQKKFDEGYDVVVLAHSHAADMMETGSGENKKIYLNTGDFFADSSYVVYETSTGYELRKHPYGEES
jgi:UDP-2,3-diacylglucosamine hydrolase